MSKMAAREKDRLGIGSTVSLQGGEYIPREYHRRILKKIAQLTKVIYNLNTKIEENEDFVASLKAIHEAENKRVLAESTAQLKRCEDMFSREKESREKALIEMREALEETRGERDQLYDKQVSYRKEVDEQLSALKLQHTTKVQTLVSELEKFQSDQEKQLKQIGDLRTKVSTKASQELKALKLEHEEELSRVRHDGQSLVQKLENEILSMRSKHSEEIDSITKKFQSQLDAQSKSYTTAQNDLLSQERQAWLEKEEQLNAAFLDREEQLKQQISNLSTELRASSDKLALAEQRIRDLEIYFHESKAESGTSKALLEKAETDIECLRETVNSLQADLDIAKEKYNQQTADLQATSGTVARLEALRVSNEGTIDSLHSELSALEEQLRLAQEERQGIENSQLSLREGHIARITALERELGKVRAGKQELHAQFAREIEAAHAQLSHRETELEQQHLNALSQIRDQHSRVLADAEEDKKLSLDSLKAQLLSEKDQELQTLTHQHSTQLSSLIAKLADKNSQLQNTLEELNTFKDKLLKEEQGLGSAISQIDQLKANLKQCQSSLLTSQRECADVKTENAQLKSTVEALQRKSKEGESAHTEEIRRTKTDLTAQLEATWKERIRHETAGLRSELMQRHNEEQRVALAELAGLKDTALKQAQESWGNERKSLLSQISSLERALHNLQQSTSVSLKEARTSSDSQISSLRKELEVELLKHQEAMANLERDHMQQIQSLHSQQERDRSTLTAQLRDKHSQELLAVQQANQLAVNSLRESLEVDKRASLTQASEEHQRQLELLEETLRSKFSGDMAQVNEEHLTEMEKFRVQIETVVTQSQQQMATQESIAERLRGELASRDSELCKLRDQGNSLTVAVADLRKQLTVKEQELQLAKREAKNTLRIREQQLVATHHTELESVNAQHRYKAQQLLSDFNKAKTLLSSKIHELERQLSDWELRYKKRDSRPEDLEAIRELKMIVREQEQKMKNLVAEKRVYQLELMNREKNYNKLFNVNPQVGVLNPLQSKLKKQSLVSTESHKYASTPSLLAPLSPEPPALNPHETPILQSLRLSALPGDGGLTSSGSQLTKKSQSLLEMKPQKLVMLKDLPLTQKRGSKQTEQSNRKSLNSHSGLLKPVERGSQSTISSQKQTMIVQ